MDELGELVRWAAEYQRVMGWGDRRMAAEIGTIGRTGWNRVRNGKRGGNGPLVLGLQRLRARLGLPTILPFGSAARERSA